LLAAAQTLGSGRLRLLPVLAAIPDPRARRGVRHRLVVILSLAVCAVLAGARSFTAITMNWRGRPLTSHEVVVQTIAATRTSRGLRVGAVLDPGDYPTGVAISKERFAALPLERHAVRGAWNYTLHPAAGAPSVGEGTTDQRPSPAHRRQEMLRKLNDERLTGMNSVELARLCAALAPIQAARAQQRYSEQRGGRARRATGKPRGKPLFDDPARVLLTLLYQRQACSMNVLADLLEVTAVCIGELVGETREVLEDHGHATGTAAVRFPTAQALRAFLDSDDRPKRTRVIEQLCHPALTGLSRPGLHKLTEQLAPLQAAQAERLGYQRRGGLRQPTARGGVFHQKISNGERVLLAILYQRRLCTMDVLASLLGVCRSSIGNAIRETRPLLDQAGHLPTPATARYRTSNDLIAAAATSQDSNAPDTAS
jgi:Rhodopirellula transposase DDE domain/DDE_Tnp_1-associated